MGFKLHSGSFLMHTAAFWVTYKRTHLSVRKCKNTLSRITSVRSWYRQSLFHTGTRTDVRTTRDVWSPEQASRTNTFKNTSQEQKKPSITELTFVFSRREIKQPSAAGSSLTVTLMVAGAPAPLPSLNAGSCLCLIREFKLSEAPLFFVLFCFDILNIHEPAKKNQFKYQHKNIRRPTGWRLDLAMDPRAIGHSRNRGRIVSISGNTSLEDGIW